MSIFDPNPQTYEIDETMKTSFVSSVMLGIICVVLIAFITNVSHDATGAGILRIFTSIFSACFLFSTSMFLYAKKKQNKKFEREEKERSIKDADDEIKKWDDIEKKKFLEVENAPIRKLEAELKFQKESIDLENKRLMVVSSWVDTESKFNRVMKERLEIQKLEAETKIALKLAYDPSPHWQHYSEILKELKNIKR